MLHYGRDIRNTLKELYETRREMLKLVGFDISFDELESFY